MNVKIAIVIKASRNHNKTTVSQLQERHDETHYHINYSPLLLHYIFPEMFGMLRKRRVEKMLREFHELPRSSGGLLSLMVHW